VKKELKFYFIYFAMAAWLSNFCLGFSVLLYTFRPKRSLCRKSENLWQSREGKRFSLQD